MDNWGRPFFADTAEGCKRRRPAIHRSEGLLQAPVGDVLRGASVQAGADQGSRRLSRPKVLVSSARPSAAKRIRWPPSAPLAIGAWPVDEHRALVCQLTGPLRLPRMAFVLSEDRSHCGMAPVRSASGREQRCRPMADVPSSGGSCDLRCCPPPARPGRRARPTCLDRPRHARSAAAPAGRSGGARGPRRTRAGEHRRADRLAV